MTIAQGWLAAISGYASAFSSPGTLTVNPALVTVTALGGSSTYGSSPANSGLSATGLQNGQSVSALTGALQLVQITGASSIGSYVMSVVGTLTNGNYTVVGSNSGTWNVMPLRGSIGGGTPTYNGPSPSNPNLLVAPPSGGSGDGALSGSANSPLTVNGGAAPGREEHRGRGGKQESVRQSRPAGCTRPILATREPTAVQFARCSARSHADQRRAGWISKCKLGAARRLRRQGRGLRQRRGGCRRLRGAVCPKKAADVMDFMLSRLNRDALTQAIGQQFSEIARSK